MNKYKDTIGKIVVLGLFLGIILLALKFCVDKEGYHLDEVYTHALSNSEYAPWIMDIKDGNIVNKIFTRQELWEFVTVSDDDRFAFDSVYYNQTQDVHPPLYYYLIHFVSSIFSDTFSKWIGLSINLVLFALTLFLLYKIIRKFISEHYSAMLTVAVYGLSSIAMSTVLFIRMYMLLTFFTLLLAYLILEHRYNSRKRIYLLIAITIFLGMLTHYYFVIYAFLVCLTYDLFLLYGKKYKEFFGFSFSALLGVISMLIYFPHYGTQLSLQSNVSMDTTIRNMRNFAKYGIRIYEVSKEAGKDSVVGVVICTFLLIVFLGIRLSKRQEIKRKLLENYSLIIIIPAFVSFGIISILEPYVTTRYVYHLIPLMMLVVAYLSDKVLSRIHENNILACVAFGTMMVASLFCLRMNKPDYVYKQSAFNALIEENSKYPCILVSENDSTAITNAIPQLLYFDDFFVTNEANMDNIYEYINKRGENKNVVVFFECRPTMVDRKAFIEKMYSLGYMDNYSIYDSEFFATHLFYSE